MKTYILYLITNIHNGKYYVGWTVQQLRDRWKDHCFNARAGEVWHLSCAIRKWGDEAFIQEVITHASTMKEVKLLEKLWICILRSYDPEIGYNLTFGGDGTSWELIPDERKIEIIAKRVEALRIRGKNPTQAMLDRYEKISAKLKGRTTSPSPKKGLTIQEFFGEEKAAKIRRKLSEFNTGLKKGVWITNGIKNQVVSEELIPEDWWRGRTQKAYKKGRIDSPEVIRKRVESSRRTRERKRLARLGTPGSPVTGALCSINEIP